MYRSRPTGRALGSTKLTVATPMASGSRVASRSIPTRSQGLDQSDPGDGGDEEAADHGHRDTDQRGEPRERSEGDEGQQRCFAWGIRPNNTIVAQAIVIVAAAPINRPKAVRRPLMMIMSGPRWHRRSRARMPPRR